MSFQQFGTLLEEETPEETEEEFSPEEIFEQFGEIVGEGDKPKPAHITARIPAKVGAEIFGGAVGAIPKLAETAAQIKPVIEQREEEARPDYLTGAGLEPAPERGLLNLMALIGQTDFVQQMLPKNLRERFKQTTGERFEPQTAVERVLSRAAGSAGEGLPFGLPGIVGGLGGLSAGVAEEAGVGEKGQNVAELLGTLGGAGLRGVAKSTKVPVTKPSGLPVRKFEALKKPKTVFKGTARKALQETEQDFRKLTSDIQTKTNQSYKAMTEDPLFKSKVSDIFETVKKEAAQNLTPVPTNDLARQLFIDVIETRKRGITRSPTEITKRSELTKFIKDTKGKEFTATKLLEQYRKNNEQLSKLYPYGESALENIGKREALESYNQAIASTIEEQFPKTDFADLFKFTNKRWSEIKKIETVDKYLNALFSKDKIVFKQAEKALTDPKYSGRLKNSLGKQGFAEFKQLNKDLLTQEKGLKLLKSKGYEMSDIPKVAVGYLFKPKITSVLIGKDFANKLWRKTLADPKKIRQWRKGVSLFNRGHIKESLTIFKTLEKSIPQERSESTNKQKQ